MGTDTHNNSEETDPEKTDEDAERQSGAETMNREIQQNENDEVPTSMEIVEEEEIEENSTAFSEETEDNHTRSTSDEVGDKQSTSAEDTKHSTSAEDTKQSTSAEDTKQSTSDEDTKQSTAAEDTKSTSDEDTKQSTSDEDTKQSTAAEDTKQSTSDEVIHKQSTSDLDDTKQSTSDGDDTKQSISDGNDTKQSTLDEDDRKQSTSDEDTKQSTSDGYDHKESTSDKDDHEQSMSDGYLANNSIMDILNEEMSVNSETLSLIYGKRHKGSPVVDLQSQTSSSSFIISKVPRKAAKRLASETPEESDEDAPGSPSKAAPDKNDDINEILEDTNGGNLSSSERYLSSNTSSSNASSCDDGCSIDSLDRIHTFPVPSEDFEEESRVNLQNTEDSLDDVNSTDPTNPFPYSVHSSTFYPSYFHDDQLMDNIINQNIDFKDLISSKLSRTITVKDMELCGFFLKREKEKRKRRFMRKQRRKLLAFMEKSENKANYTDNDGTADPGGDEDIDVNDPNDDEDDHIYVDDSFAETDIVIDEEIEESCIQEDLPDDVPSTSARSLANLRARNTTPVLNKIIKKIDFRKERLYKQLKEYMKSLKYDDLLKFTRQFQNVQSASKNENDDKADSNNDNAPEKLVILINKGPNTNEIDEDTITTNPNLKIIDIDDEHKKYRIMQAISTLRKDDDPIIFNMNEHPSLESLSKSTTVSITLSNDGLFAKKRKSIIDTFLRAGGFECVYQNSIDVLSYHHQSTLVSDDPTAGKLEKSTSTTTLSLNPKEDTEDPIPPNNNSLTRSRSAESLSDRPLDLTFKQGSEFERCASPQTHPLDYTKKTLSLLGKGAISIEDFQKRLSSNPSIPSESLSAIQRTSPMENDSDGDALDEISTEQCLGGASRLARSPSAESSRAKSVSRMTNSSNSSGSPSPVPSQQNKSSESSPGGRRRYSTESTRPITSSPAEIAITLRRSPSVDGSTQASIPDLPVSQYSPRSSEYMQEIDDAEGGSPNRSNSQMSGAMENMIESPLNQPNSNNSEDSSTTLEVSETPENSESENIDQDESANADVSNSEEPNEGMETMDTSDTVQESSNENTSDEEESSPITPQTRSRSSERISALFRRITQTMRLRSFEERRSRSRFRNESKSTDKNGFRETALTSNIMFHSDVYNANISIHIFDDFIVVDIFEDSEPFISSQTSKISNNNTLNAQQWYLKLKNSDKFAITSSDPNKNYIYKNLRASEIPNGNDSNDKRNDSKKPTLKVRSYFIKDIITTNTNTDKKKKTNPNDNISGDNQPDKEQKHVKKSKVPASDSDLYLDYEKVKKKITDNVSFNDVFIANKKKDTEVAEPIEHQIEELPPFGKYPGIKPNKHQMLSKKPSVKFVKDNDIKNLDAVFELDYEFPPSSRKFGVVEEPTYDNDYGYDADTEIDRNSDIGIGVAVEEPVAQAEQEYIYHGEREHFSRPLMEVARRLWKSDQDNQMYTKGCLWSPDGSCILVPVNNDGMHIMECPTDLYNMTVAKERPVSVLKTAVHIPESGPVYDFAWYPLMNSASPITCAWIATRQNEPIKMWDAFDGSLRATYNGINQLDEVETAISVAFSKDSSLIYAGYKKCIRIFQTAISGRASESIRSRSAVSCFAGTEDASHIITCGSWTGHIRFFDLRTECKEATSTIAAHPTGVTWLRYLTNPSWNLFSGARKNDRILQWDMRNISKPINEFMRDVVTNQRVYFDFTPNFEWLITGDTDGCIRIFDRLDPNNSKKVFMHYDVCNGVNFHPFLPILATSAGQYHFLNQRHIIADVEENEKVYVGYENSLLLSWLGKHNDDEEAISPVSENIEQNIEVEQE